MAGLEVHPAQDIEGPGIRRIEPQALLQVLEGTVGVGETLASGTGATAGAYAALSYRGVTAP